MHEPPTSPPHCVCYRPSRLLSRRGDGVTNIVFERVTFPLNFIIGNSIDSHGTSSVFRQIPSPFRFVHSSHSFDHHMIIRSVDCWCYLLLLHLRYGWQVVSTDANMRFRHPPSRRRESLRSSPLPRAVHVDSLPRWNVARRIFSNVLSNRRGANLRLGGQHVRIVVMSTS